MAVRFGKASSKHGLAAVAALAVVLLIISTARGEPASSDSEIAFFRERIEPVLAEYCFPCHSSQADVVEGGLRLDNRASLLRGGDSGSVVDPQHPDESLLLKALRHEDGLQMPPDEPQLASEIIADFRRWIASGAPDPRDAPDATEDRTLAAARQHWAFQPVRSVVPPQVANVDWLRSPIDAFVLEQLESRDWHPSPPAEPAVWLRRVTFDLTGLPPTPEEIRDFSSDMSIDARQRVVDRLLASPRYGERFAQLWLDVVRYAETEGFEYDRHLPGAWRYRDYVINAFNRDKPYDRFVVEQLAGDEIAADDLQCQIATIFHRLGPVRRNAGNPEIALSRNEVLTERTNIIGDVFLGLSIGCARCHNHKLEPISQQDYYQLQAYFAATQEHNIVLTDADQQRAWQQTTDEIQSRIKALQEAAKQAVGQQQARLRQEAEELEVTLPPALPTIPAIHNDAAARTPIHVLRRGVWEHKGIAVGPRPPTVLVSDATAQLPADIEAPRTQLANWLVDARHPLTARVMVNRLWQHHFGQGLVRTANDFGTHGDTPSHPELLDWLAGELIRNGWQLKPLHREIVLSSTYGQSSDFRRPPTGLIDGVLPHVADPENRYLWRFARRRLSAEELRDAMLAVSGRLNLEMFGPSVIVPVDKQLVELLYKPSQWQVTADRSQHARRSIYLIAKRNLRLPFLEAFDSPALQSSCPQRSTSTHAPQALEMLNGSLANELAFGLAERLQREAAQHCSDARQRDGWIVERAFWLALGRRPTETERQLSLEFLLQQPLSEFALAILNLNGFVYVH